MFRTIVVLVLVTVLSTAAGYAQQTAVDPSAEVDAIDRIDTRLEEIARSLREMLSHQRLLLTMRQIELVERRLEPLEREHRRAQEDVRAADAQITQLAGIAENFREQIDRAVRQGADPREVTERSELERLEAMLELQQEQLEAAELRVIEADNDLSRGRTRIEILDDKLEALLEKLEL
jgi:hypothetical protein